MLKRNYVLPLLIFSFLILNFSFLIAQDVIIDSVISNHYLDGEIFFRQSTQEFEVTWFSYGFDVGDTGMGINPDPNSRSRGYISFDLPEIPEGYLIDSVFVRLDQIHSYGNNEPGVFPIWDVAGGDTMFCIMDHIDYGNSLDTVDWTAGDPGDPQTLHTNIGVISDSAENGYRYLGVTEYVQDDYNNSRSKSQYRIYFPIETDWDYWYDKIGFYSGECYDEHAPVMFIYFEQESNVFEDQISEIHNIFNIYPNPFKISTKIKYSNLNENVSIRKLSIYNIKGQKIKVLKFNKTDNITWAGNDQNNLEVSNGIYFLRAKTNNNYSITKKIIKMK